MQLWEVRFRDHELWRLVEQARATMNHVEHPVAQADRDALDYAGMVLELLEKRREDTDGREVSPNMLATTQNAVQNYVNALEYVQAGQYNWQQMVAPTDDVVNSLGWWPPLKIARYLSGISSAVDAFQRRTSEAADAVATRADDVASALAELTTQQAALEAAVTAERQRITEAIAKFTSDGNDAVHEWISDQEDSLTERASKWDAQIEAAKRTAAEHNATMADYEAKSRKVLEAVGVNATATDFGAYAKDQKETADTWRKFAALVFVLAGVWFIASSLPWFTEGTQVWQSSLARLGVTAAVAGVGAYAARESSQHRRQERQAKRVQLVLTALEPFIVNLPEDDQNSIRAESARAIFVLGNDDGPDVDEALGGAYGGLLKDLLAKIPDRI